MEKELEIIREIFNTNQEIKFTPLDGGLSNDNYIFEIDGVKYVLRVCHPIMNEINNRNDEYKNLLLVQDYDVDVPMIYFNTETGMKITKYVHYCYNLQNVELDSEAVKKMALTLRDFHKIDKLSENDFDPLVKLETYKSKITTQLYKIDEEELVISKTKVLYTKYPLTFCHNDLVPGNVLVGRTKTYLIDYEYAGNNIYLFDIMSFITENNIVSKDLVFLFYTAYLGYPASVDLLIDLEIMACFEDLLWFYWANMMYDLCQTDIYRDIATTKYHAYNQRLKIMKERNA